MSIADKLVLIAENEQKVYKAGRDSFWDACQDNGKRTNYKQAFWMGFNFNKYNFYPKYDIKPEGNAQQMFYALEKEQHKMDLTQRLKECGVVLDTSKATGLDSAFNFTRFTSIPTIDCSGLKGSVYAMISNDGGVLETVEKIIVSDAIKEFKVWFQNSKGLKNIVFEGEIAGTGLDFSPCTILTAESIESIINALSNNTSGIVLTLSLQAVNKAFETEEGLLNGNISEKWTSLVESKKNWTISLI